MWNHDDAIIVLGRGGLGLSKQRRPGRGRAPDRVQLEQDSWLGQQGRAGQDGRLCSRIQHYVSKYVHRLTATMTTVIIRLLLVDFCAHRALTKRFFIVLLKASFLKLKESDFT